MPPDPTAPPSPTAGPRRSDEAFRQIAATIHEGRMAPGERLPAERELAERLRVSRATLRDALNRLEARGYIERRTGSGNYVCTSVPAAAGTPLEDGIRERIVTLQQVIDVRKPLEIWGAAEAARRHSKARQDELRGAMAAMRAAGGGRRFDEEAYSRADIQFHLAIAKMTGNPVYLHTIHFLTDLIAQSLSTSREVLDADFTAANDARHEAVCEAIAAGEPTAAAEAMAAHFVLIEQHIRPAAPA